MEKISIFLRQFGWYIFVGLVGCGILGYGLWGQLAPKPAVVEIVKGKEDKKEDGIVVVDVAGSVINPGVYQLPSLSRIGDALVLAGGLSQNADREWVAKTINLAEILKDGGKIYIPAKVEGKVQGVSSVKVEVSSGRVNINNASLGELDSLTGIGEVRAKAIIENRPYGSVEEIVDKAKIPRSVYEEIKDKVSVY